MMMRILSVWTLMAVLAAAPATAQQVSDDTMNEFQRQVNGQLDDAQAVLEQEGYVQVSRYIGASGLGETESHEQELQLEANYDYVITAVCDSDCADLDLVLYASGNEVARDTESDAYPILSLRPNAIAHQIEVIMYGCEAEPCYYGFGVFRQ
ncbi:MAG: hypothetical protein WBA10_16855 [Elainellaceae cyanobacterium]